ncbi:MAG: hypothetical protein WDM92_16275 [Caulobacteraceae bacterium]
MTRSTPGGARPPRRAAAPGEKRSGGLHADEPIRGRRHGRAGHGAGRGPADAGQGGPAADLRPGGLRPRLPAGHGRPVPGGRGRPRRQPPAARARLPLHRGRPGAEGRRRLLGLGLGPGRLQALLPRPAHQPGRLLRRDEGERPERDPGPAHEAGGAQDQRDRDDPEPLGPRHRRPQRLRQPGGHGQAGRDLAAGRPAGRARHARGHRPRRQHVFLGPAERRRQGRLFVLRRRLLPAGERHPDHGRPPPRAADARRGQPQGAGPVEDGLQAGLRHRLLPDGDAHPRPALPDRGRGEGRGLHLRLLRPQRPEAGLRAHRRHGPARRAAGALHLGGRRGVQDRQGPDQDRRGGAEQCPLRHEGRLDGH